MHILSLIFGLFIVAVALLIAAFITKYFYGPPTNFNKDDYFQSNYGDRLAYLIKDGLSRKKAYEKIIAERDYQARNIVMWGISLGLIWMLITLFPNILKFV